MQLRVFVAMPFGRREVRPADTARAPAQPAIEADFDKIYTELLAPALEQAGCEPFRADREPNAGDIRTDMFFELVTADFVLADISTLNPNVFYELGVRHGVAPRGVLMVHGGWGRPPFDVAPDRTFDYDGSLFELPLAYDGAWRRRVGAQATLLAARLIGAIDTDEQGIGSPVYKELVDLKPVDWSMIQTARAKYFQGVLDDWRQRVRVARKNGYPGDILTLAADAPTRVHRARLLLEAARGLLDLCRFDIAKDVLEQVLAIDDTNIDAQCQLGLTLGRLGKLPAAEEHMARVAQNYPPSPEVQGILGRIYKDLWRDRWEQLAQLQERQQVALDYAASAVRALQSYDRAQRHDLDSYYNGINVVCLVKLLDHLRQATDRPPVATGVTNAKDLAVVVRVAASNDLERARSATGPEEQAGVIWSAATLGELELLVGRPDRALGYYNEASATPGVTYFQIESMLGQLRMLAQLGFRLDAVTKIIGLLERRRAMADNPDTKFRHVIVASGHMIDMPGRSTPRFPAHKEPAVREQLAARLEAWGIGEGDLAICGGARGADILFAELCLARGAHVRLMLALPQHEFIRQSVQFGASTWTQRFSALHDRCEVADQDERLGRPPDGITVFERNNIWMLHTAQVEQRSGNLYAALVWDKQPTGDGPGGTSDFAARVTRAGGEIAIVDPTVL